MINCAPLPAAFDPGPMLDGVADGIRRQFGIQRAVEVAEAAIARFRAARKDEDVAIWLALHARLAVSASCLTDCYKPLN